MIGGDRMGVEPAPDEVRINGVPPEGPRQISPGAHQLHDHAEPVIFELDPREAKPEGAQIVRQQVGDAVVGPPDLDAFGVRTDDNLSRGDGREHGKGQRGDGQRCMGNNTTHWESPGPEGPRGYDRPPDPRPGRSRTCVSVRSRKSTRSWSS